MDYSDESTQNVQQMPSDSPHVKVEVPIKALAHLVPFPHRLKNTKLEKQFAKFSKVLKTPYINVPLIDVILQILNYSKFLKEILNKKWKLPEHETIALFEECSMAI